MSRKRPNKTLKEKLLDKSLAIMKKKGIKYSVEEIERQIKEIR